MTAGTARPSGDPGEPRRVLFLTTSYPPAPGVPSGPFVHRLAARLVAAGREVSVLAPGAPDAESRVEDGVAIRFFRYAPRGLERVAHGAGIPYNLAADRRRLALLPGFAAAFAASAVRMARGVDVVHAHWLPTAAVGRVTRRPLVTTVHGSDLGRGAGTGALARLAAAGGPILAVNGELADALRRLAPGADVRVVPPEGVAVDPLPFADADPRRVLFAGRLVDIKGIDTLMAAWPAVREAVPDATLDVVGEGPLRGLLRGPGVHVHGVVAPAELRRRYREAAMICVPSRRDSFSLVCLEAMAAGRAVVATPVGDMARRIRDGEDGLLVATDDPAALAAALVRLLADPDLAARMGRSAAARVGALYRWDAVIDATLAAYATAAARSRPSRVLRFPR